MELRAEKISRDFLRPSAPQGFFVDFPSFWTYFQQTQIFSFLSSSTVIPIRPPRISC